MNDERTIQIDRNLLRWVLLALGGLGLLVAVVAVIASSGTTFGERLDTASPYVYIALAVGVLGLAGFIFIDPQSITEAVTGRTGQYAITSWGLGIAFVVLVIAAYVILKQVNLDPIDLSEAQEYSISDETRDLLETLEEPITAYGFYTEGSSEQETAELWLSQYERSAPDGMFTYDFYDPDRNPALAQRLGIDSGGVIMLEQGDRTQQIDFPSERELTTGIVRVLLGDPRVAYYTIGHGERDFTDFGGTQAGNMGADMERANFTLNPLNLVTSEEGVPSDADLLIIGGATSQFAPAEIEAIRAYVDGGGKLLVLADPGDAGVQSSGLLSVDFQPDGTRIVGGSSDGAVIVWRASVGSVFRTMRGHTLDVIDTVYSPGGEQVASVSADGTIRVWDVASGDTVAEPQGATDLASALAYSPDGALLVSVGEDQVINVWDTDTYEPAYAPLTTSVPLIAVTFSPDGSLIAAAGGRGSGAGGFVFLFDAATGEQVLSQALHENTVFDVEFSPDGETLYSSALDGTLGSIDIETGAGSVDALYPDLGMTAIAVDSDGDLYYAVGDGTIRYGDTVITAHEDIIWDLDLSPDGTTLASAGRDGLIRVWDVESGEMLNELIAEGGATSPLLNYLLEDWGISADNNLVLDVRTASNFSADVPVIYSWNTSSSITQTLNEQSQAVFLPLARSVSQVATPPESVQLTSLGFTTEDGSWGETNRFGQYEYDEADLLGPLAIAVSGENTSTGARVVVVGDADFVSNDALQYSTFSNDQFFLNAANWLTESEDAISLPSPDVGSRTFDRPFTRLWLNVTMIFITCLVPLFVAGTGLVLWFARRRRR